MFASFLGSFYVFQSLKDGLSIQEKMKLFDSFWFVKDEMLQRKNGPVCLESPFLFLYINVCHGTVDNKSFTLFCNSCQTCITTGGSNKLAFLCADPFKINLYCQVKTVLDWIYNIYYIIH